MKFQNYTPFGTDPILDQDVISTNPDKRLDIALDGYGLDKLVEDENFEIRNAAIESAILQKNFPLKRYINSNSDMRKAIASQNLWPEIFVHDEDPKVRAEVAKHGYGLLLLIEDEDEDVRRQAVTSANKNERFNWSRFVRSHFDEPRGFAALNGYGVEELIEDNDTWVRNMAIEFAKTQKNFPWHNYLHSGHANTRITAIDQLTGLNPTYLRDPDPEVRKALAKCGYGLPVLIEDENESVRAAVARQGYGLHKLIEDEDEHVRFWAIANAKEDERFDWSRHVDSHCWEVRKAVAEQGYETKYLLQDENKEVRKTAIKEATKSRSFSWKEFLHSEFQEIADLARDYMQNQY